MNYEKRLRVGGRSDGIYEMVSGRGIEKRRGKETGEERARVSGLAGCTRTICNGMRARFGARGHTFNFAGPITKSDMHHSEINSQQRTHVLFVMSRSKLRAGNERGGEGREEGG